MRVLAHLGDAVFSLYEREQEALSCVSAKQIHGKVIARVSAAKQAAILFALTPNLLPDELEIVRMARNLKPSSYRKAGQTAYRQSTAFEALLGYLYLCDQGRLCQVLSLTRAGGEEPEQPGRP